MTVDELTRQTLYRRAAWQRVHDTAMEMPGGDEHWDSICRQAVKNSMVSPAVAETMLRMVVVPGWVIW